MDDAPTGAQKRQDLALLLGATAVCALLLAVAALRPTPDRGDVVLIMYAIGGVLEVVGIGTVALDLRARRRRWRRFQSGAGVMASGRNLRMFAPTLPPWGDLAARVAVLERGLREQMATLDREGAQREMALINLIGTYAPDTAAWLGFVALLLGVLVGTAANALSAAR